MDTLAKLSYFEAPVPSNTQQVPVNLQAFDLYGFFSGRRADFPYSSNTQQANSGPGRQTAPGFGWRVGVLHADRMVLEKGC
jgi:hypothetical protein